MLRRDAFTLLGILGQVLHLPRVVSFRQLRPFGSPGLESYGFVALTN